MISKVRKKIIHLTNKKGIIGYISSLIFFTYASIKSFSSLRLAALQAYNRQGFDIIYGVDTFEELTSNKLYSKNISSPDLVDAVN